MRSHHVLLSAAVCLLLACPNSPSSAPTDGGTEADQGIAPITVGLLQDCSPGLVGYGDVVCAAGLRCAFVLVGDGTGDSGGELTQCVPAPTAEQTLREGQACAYDQQLTSPTEPLKRFDRCAPGLTCVRTPSDGLRCQRPCRLRTRGACAESELCVAPTQVTGIGYCAAPDRCQPIAPQSGCRGVDGGATPGCYVLGDDKGAGTVCVAQRPYGDGNGKLDAPCERSWSCQPGLSCVTINGHNAVCRPYCPLPIPPDGGLPADMGEVHCAGDLGTCHSLINYDGVGQCY